MGLDQAAATPEGRLASLSPLPSFCGFVPKHVCAGLAQVQRAQPPTGSGELALMFVLLCNGNRTQRQGVARCAGTCHGTLQP